MNVLIVYSKAPEEITNRRSALGSYIYCLAEIIHKTHLVFINDKNFTEIQNSQSKSVIASKENSIKKYVPKIIKSIIKDLTIFKKNKQLQNEILKVKQKFDVILEFYSYGSNTGVCLKNKLKIPLITILDAPILDEYTFFFGKKLFLKNAIAGKEKKSLEASNAIVVYSSPMKKYATNLSGKEKNIFIHQNIDFSRYSKSNEPKEDSIINIGFIGSFLKWHKVDMLLKSFEEFVESNPNHNCMLYLIGDGMEYQNISNQVEKSRCKNKVVMTGFLDGNELEAKRALLHIGIMPGSNWYGIPNKIFEYVAGGMLVLAPATPSIEDVFKNKGVVLFEPDNDNDFKQKFQDLILNYTNLLQDNLAQVTNFTQEFSLQNTENFYLKLINNIIIQSI